MSSEFHEVYFHRMRYFLTPQFDLYKNVRDKILTGKGDDSYDRRLILDYGCGNGVGSVLLKTHNLIITGIDSDEEAVEFANDAWGHQCSFFHENWAVEDAVFRSQSNHFDAVVCLEVIEHVERPEILLAALKYRLRPGGQIFISTLNHNSQYRKNRGHIGKFCLGDFQQLVRKYFPEARFFDYTLENELESGSSITPMVAVWGGE